MISVMSNDVRLVPVQFRNFNVLGSLSRSPLQAAICTDGQLMRVLTARVLDGDQRATGIPADAIQYSALVMGTFQRHSDEMHSQLF